MYKAELKTKYKDLVRQGSIKEAEKVLDKLRVFSREGSLPKSSKKEIVKEDDGYSREELEAMTFSEVRDVGYDLGVKGRSKSGLIDDILAVQSGEKEPEIN